MKLTNSDIHSNVKIGVYLHKKVMLEKLKNIILF